MPYIVLLEGCQGHSCVAIALVLPAPTHAESTFLTKNSCFSIRIRGALGTCHEGRDARITCHHAMTEEKLKG